MTTNGRQARRGSTAGTRAAVVLLAAALLGGAPGRAAAGAEDWNDKQIAWRPYEEGLKEAKASGKPVCLVFYTTWCPHCAKYARVFFDPAVVERARSFVMIRVDKDRAPDISSRYKPDGEYIPRTYFLSPDGVLDDAITEARPQYRYFYDTMNPAGLLGGMERALKKFGTKAGG